jgi:hypothetical protein
MAAGRRLIDERLCFFFWIGQVLAIGSLMVVKLRLISRRAKCQQPRLTVGA